jgi:hypothetical protein
MANNTNIDSVKGFIDEVIVAQKDSNENHGGTKAQSFYLRVLVSPWFGFFIRANVTLQA